MQKIKLGETSAPLKVIPFVARDSAVLTTRLDASGLAFTVRVIKPDGTSVAGAAVGGIGGHGITQPDLANARGCCFYTPTGTDIDMAGAHFVRISAAGMDPVEATYYVTNTDPSSQLAVDSVMDPNAPLNAKTFQEQWNCLFSREQGDATGLDGPVFATKSLNGLIDRNTGTISSGKRTFTKRDGRP